MSQAVQLSVANFKTGAFITIENKIDHDYFFIIRQGQVRSQRSIASSTQDAQKTLGPGDFFGVIGAMTGHARIETTVAATPTSLIAVKRDQFGFLIQKNTPLAMKIIRQFSKDLRYLNTELASRSTKSTHDDDNPDNLFHAGEYYFKAGNRTTAAYIYAQYIRHTPNGSFIGEAKQKLQTLSDAAASLQNRSTDINRSYRDGEMIFSEFEPGQELFIIQSGKVKITKIINGQEILIAVLNPGDIFGEMSLLENKPRTAAAIAFGETNLMAVNKANFDKIVVQNTNMATKLITLLSDRIWTIYKQLANLMLRNPVTRLLDTLLTQILKQHINVNEKRPYSFNIGPDEILKMVGLDGPEGKEAISKLFEKKFLAIQGNKIMCEDISELQKEVTMAYNIQQREMKLEAAKKGRSH